MTGRSAAAPPFGWYGGKRRLAHWIASLLPPHRVYVEAFGGSGAVLFAKGPSDVEIFNDLDHGVTNFYRVLRDPEQRARLLALLALTPYGRVEYVCCRDSWETEPDPVEMARRWYVTARQSFACRMNDRSGWSLSVAGGNNPSRWHRGIGEIERAAARLHTVGIECCDYRDLFRRVDAPDTCWYLDPPYAPKARKDPSHGYRCEFADADYADLVGEILALRGAVVLSCYHSDLDRPLEVAGWLRLDRAHDARTAARSGKDTAALRRTETLWLSRPVPRLEFGVAT